MFLSCIFVLFYLRLEEMPRGRQHIENEGMDFRCWRQDDLVLARPDGEEFYCILACILAWDDEKSC